MFIMIYIYIQIHIHIYVYISVYIILHNIYYVSDLTRCRLCRDLGRFASSLCGWSSGPGALDRGLGFRV